MGKITDYTKLPKGLITQITEMNVVIFLNEKRRPSFKGIWAEQFIKRGDEKIVFMNNVLSVPIGGIPLEVTCTRKSAFIKNNRASYEIKKIFIMSNGKEFFKSKMT
jgi:hypothetical protein